MQQALRHHRAQRLTEASALYRRVLATEPNNPAALQNLGLIAIHRGRFPFAVELIGKAVVHQPDDAGAHYNLGVALQGSRRWDEALQSYDRAITLRPDFAEAFYNRANVLRERGRLAQAIADYRQALAIDPGLVAAYANTANCLAALGRADEAVANYQAALARAPNEAEIHNNLGAVLADLGRIDEAVAAYRHALSLDPRCADAWFNLHSTLYDGDFERAADCLEQMLKITPDNVTGRFLLAVLRDRQGQEAVAGAHFAALPPDDVLTRYGRDAWDYVKSTGAGVRLFGETAEGLALGLAAASLDGLVLEFGVRYGSTIRQIAARAEQEVHGFDSFTGLPEDWHGRPANTFSADGELPQVPPNVHLHVGLFEDTLPPFLEAHAGPAGFVNVDCDLYSSTKTVLTLLAPRIVPGTVMVFDEYLFAPHWRDDEYKAFQEAVVAHGWRYDYLGFSPVSRQAVVIIR